MAEALSYLISASSSPAEPSNIMVVDDDRTTLMMLTQALGLQGHRVTGYKSGEEAMTAMLRPGHKMDTLILDREMPGLNGLGVVGKMKAHERLKEIPIIMLTGSGSAEQIQEGLDAGVFYYLVKPAGDTVLKSVVGAALRERRQKMLLGSQIVRRDAALKGITTCQMKIRNLTEAEDAACFIAYCFPVPERVVTGLLELLINAVEHGNLGITYEEKAELLVNNKWREEVERRLMLPENAKKIVELIYQNKPDGHYVQITDEGNGFDWKKFWQIDPARATAPHGRGIARARLVAFDKLFYNNAGNQVTGIVSGTNKIELEW